MKPTLVRRGAILFALAFVTPFVLAAQAATGTVSGRITDASIGRGLPDVQVTIAGTRIGAITGPNGEYTLVGVPVGSRTITARRIGYQATTRTVDVVSGGTATADVALNVSAVNLSEVVVTGTGTATEKRKVGTSIATVDSALISRAQAGTVDQAMQGKIPGAQITQNSGSPGGGGISVRLRGVNSFISGSDPLYIVDGVIVDNQSGAARRPRHSVQSAEPSRRSQSFGHRAH